MAKHNSRALPKTYGELIKAIVREALEDIVSTSILIPIVLVGVYFLKVAQFTFFGY